jgi:NTP pyrophosphatase (non-canonical NTP hydrolase)
MKTHDPLILRNAIQAAQASCHNVAQAAGWWTDLKTGADLRCDYRRTLATSAPPGRNIGELLALIHSEISEAMEGARKGLMDDKLPHRPMLEVELADALIRICDMAGGMGLDLAGAVTEKLEFNARRIDHTPAARSAIGGKSF